MQSKKPTSITDNTTLAVAGKLVPSWDALFGRSTLPVYVTDIRGTICFANDLALNLLGLARDQVLGFSPEALVSVEDAAALVESDLRVLCSGHAEAVPQRVNVQGRVQDFVAHKSPVIGTGDQIIGVLTMAADNTWERHQQRNLQKSEARIRRALKTSTGIVYEWEPASGMLLYSAGFHDLVGAEPEDKSSPEAWLNERMHPEDRERAAARAEMWLASLEDEWTTEFRVRHADGHWVTLWDRAVIERHADGSTARVTGNVTDITERRALEQRWQFAAEATGAGTCEADLRKGTIRFDDVGASIFGLASSQELPVSVWRDLILPDDWSAIAERLQELMQMGRSASVEYRIRRPDGALRWILGTARLERDAENQPARLLIVVQDFTARRRTEADLRDAEQRFKLLVDNLDDVFWIVDWRSRRHIYASPAYSKVWGLDLDTLYKSLPRWPEYIHPDDRAYVQTVFDTLDRVAPGQDHFAVEYRMSIRGELRWIRDRGIAVRDAKGEISRVIGLAEDITDRRTVIRTLQESEQRLQLAIDASELHVWALEAKTRRFTASEALCRIFGLTLQQCRRMGPWRRRLHPEDRARVEKALRLLIENGQPLHEEFRVMRPCGAIAWLDVRAILLQTDAQAVRVHGVAADVTQRKEQVQALFDSERELRTITATLPVGIARIGTDRRYQFVNEAHARFMMRQPEEVIGQTINAIVGDAAYARLSEYVDRVLEGTRVEFEIALQLPSGYRYVHGTYVPEFDERSAVIAFVAVVEDITARKIAEAKLYERERDFKALAENAPDMISRVDRDLRYLYVNRAAEISFGISRERYLGMTARAIGFPTPYVNATQTIVAQAFSGQNEQTTSFSISRDAGDAHYIARAVPEIDRRGLVESVLLIIYDVSERVRSQIERDSLLSREHEARELAEAAARGRDEFLAIVSHELRSPLNGIQSWAHVLEARNDNPAIVHRAVAGIKTSVEQQVRLINDLLDATRIMSGKLSISKVPVTVRPVILTAIESVLPKAKERGILVETDIRLDQESVDGDSDRIQQIIWNLLSNAIKFTPTGGHVLLSAHVDSRQLTITVRDDGRGISAEFLPHLFKRFRRDETGNTRGQDGLGLGLTLVRHLCELHQGNVFATSPGPDRGASFTVTLPLLLSSRPLWSGKTHSLAMQLPTLQGVRVLLVDDHIDSRDALALLLRDAGAIVEVFSSGDEVVQRVRMGDPREAPNILICDIAMPGKDGYQALAEIRAHERLAGLSRLPAIALTAFAQNHDRVRALNAGFEVHISKPVSIEELTVTMAAYARHRSTSTS